ncbi:DUF262 domain-containing protein [Pareuzebyella sediminis]|uniref:DUF262 domain-containing protein n=1 Tax=Pareuzebyella sediminis TaxID=2607998 RepID=UPI0018E16A48|nr:DUF262 domain-containing protein [Pareuzebyella sediminis]
MNLHTKIIQTKDLLSKKNLCIPEYQRPYKWSIKNVNQLIDDIFHHRNRSAYRLGTIVFYRDEKKKLNIVDGQQRTITLILIAIAIYQNINRLQAELKKAKVDAIYSEWFEGLSFSNSISLKNIQNHYREIARRVDDFDVDTVLFFYQKCELVEVILEDVSEAFQFFDSQNARGKDLEPHDLLKAYHLREMSKISTEAERLKSVETWEGLDTDELKSVFANYLYRIRNWSRGASARKFDKNRVDIFKGISPSVEEPFPFADLYRIGHFYVEGYNQDFHRNIDQKSMAYPFQIDQVIINGKRFFEMINHYIGQVDLEEKLKNVSDHSKKILKTLNTYNARTRSGDQYVRSLFDCALVYYLDKFGMVEIDRAIEKFFLWAYSLRLNLQNVQLASMDNYALEAPFTFKTIKDAIHPKEVLSLSLSVVNQVRSSKTKELEAIFKRLNYLHG